MIAKIRGMRTFTKADRLQADTVPEIRYGLGGLAHLLGRKFKVGRRTASEGHFLNAAVVILLGMADEERERALGQAFAKINALLALDEPTEEAVAAILAGRVAPGEGRGHGGGIYPVTPLENVFPTAKKKGRKKSGNGGEGA